MDIDFWSSRGYSAKDHSAVHPSLNSDNHLIMDESEGSDYIKAYFPCPFCYLDIEVHLICSHLQEEHCFDFKNAVCPLCAANLQKDAVEHFIVHHASSLKCRKKSLKSGCWHGVSAMLSRELSSFLGSSTIGRGNACECIPDPLLSPFLCPAVLSETKGFQKDDCSNEISVATDLERYRSHLFISDELNNVYYSSILATCSISISPTLLNNGREENNEEKRQRTMFIQQLIMSTVF